MSVSRTSHKRSDYGNPPQLTPIFTVDADADVPRRPALLQASIEAIGTGCRRHASGFGETRLPRIAAVAGRVGEPALCGEPTIGPAPIIGMRA
jgi:hypothetical protein